MRPARNRFTASVALTLALLLLGLLLAIRTHASTQADIDSIRKLGFATDSRQLAAEKHGDGDQAMMTYFDVAGCTSKGSLEYPAFATLQRIETHVEYPASAHARQCLDSLSNQVDEVERASLLPFCSAAPVYKQPMNAEFTGFFPTSHVSQLLSLAARVELAHGKAGKAFDDMAAAERIAAQVGRNPGFMASEIALLDEDFAFENWEKGLQANADDRASVLAALAVAQNGPPVTSMRRILDGEVSNALDAYRMARRDPSTIERYTTPPGYSILFRNGIGVGLAVRTMVGDWLDVLRMIPKNENDSLGFRSVLEKESAVFQRQFWASSNFSDMFEVYARQADFILASVARRRVARAAGLALLYRLDHGRLPDSLPVSRAEGTDPFNGQSLHYKTGSGGFVVYSVGANGKDDGGRQGQPNDPAGSDVAMRFEVSG